MAGPREFHAGVGGRALPLSAQEFAELGGRKLVYVRTVVAREVLDELVDDEGAPLADVPEDATLYSVHAADGERIALVGDRELAFAAARQHEMNPVSVH
ncbi:DUF1150 family protein [Amphiplicatus metriothermophilus]|uniref:DUF1150 domain-containing protein n=1 Tax=Amphiplicatus metriothermophilus TaxID=1519374 RepID=A0A239PKL5_9PROT|nr:DUF1150 domain-containing protein [Amphiplicatus metriothermophilus]MBB5517302.1 hypothetical protein [Amphiplicatus metriothermophilus]SNT68362.1 hypothetical protein SAMN06297382_0864 [Amphiplicatus metriothermophilus]